MRVAAYLRETPDPAASPSAFAQHEEVRRYAADRGLLLAAVCQDHRQPGHATGRDGYLSLLGVIAAGAVDAVVLPGLDTLAADDTAQEVALWDLRRRGVQVLSTRPDDEALLDSSPSEPRRQAIRDALQELAEPSLPIDAAPTDTAVAPDGDVLVHIIAADDAEQGSR